MQMASIADRLIDKKRKLEAAKEEIEKKKAASTKPKKARMKVVAAPKKSKNKKKVTTTPKEVKKPPQELAAGVDQLKAIEEKKLEGELEVMLGEIAKTPEQVAAFMAGMELWKSVRGGTVDQGLTKMEFVAQGVLEQVESKVDQASLIMKSCQLCPMPLEQKLSMSVSSLKEISSPRVALVSVLVTVRLLNGYKAKHGGSHVIA